MATMYFVGVTTGHSVAPRVWSDWAKIVGIPAALLQCIDVPVDAPASVLRDALWRIRDDPDSSGALITTHKVRIHDEHADFFAEFSPDASLLGEVGCAKRRDDGSFAGLAPDVSACGLAMQSILGDGQFTGDVLILGAGGAARAILLNLRRHHDPRRVAVTDVLPHRLAAIARVDQGADRVMVRTETDTDRQIATLGRGALIVNATGVGKDRPGSPIGADASFQEDAIAWDLNYRGDLQFLEISGQRGALCVDGWDYFVHGLSEVMSLVFSVDIPPQRRTTMRQVAALTRTPQ